MKIVKYFMVGLLAASMQIAFAKNMNENSASDSSITTNVENKISGDSSLAGKSIMVKTDHHVVILSGTVDSEAEATQATQIAQSIAGVKDVDTDKLIVKGSTQPFKDSYITAKVKGMFLQQKLFGDKDVAAISISVETNNGIVTLSGTADNQQQLDNAIKIAKKIVGVKIVKSLVKLNGSESNAVQPSGQY